MQDPVRHVVVDACVLSAFLHPGSTVNLKVRERSRLLLAAALMAKWPGLKLYTPATCIAEAMCVLDKFRFCTWHGPVKADSSKQLGTKEYEAARNLLAEVVKKRLVEQIEHEPAHVLLAGLVSPINNRYQIRRKRRGKGKSFSPIRPPMGAADCVIAGMTIHLANRMGRESVVLITADQRLADVVRKAGRLKPQRAESLGLVSAAEQLGMTWSHELYPRVVNIQKANERELKDAFGGWPLPTTPLAQKRRAELSDTEAKLLVNSWLYVAEEYGLSNPDTLPYTDALEDIKTRFAVASSVYLSNQEVFRFLLRKRKSSELPRPGERYPLNDVAPEQGCLFD